MDRVYMRNVVERSVWALKHGGRTRRSTRRRGLGRGAEIEQLEQRTLLSVSILNGGGSGYVGNGGGSPPDVTGMAGPSSYIEVTNNTITIISPKPGGAILAQHGISDFFYGAGIGNESLITPGSSGAADSTGIFDNLMGGDGRFIIGDINIEGDATANASQFVFAVSKSNNPTTLTKADWNFYHVTTTEGGAPSHTSTWTDYPGNFGFNADAVVVTFNMAQFNTGAGKNFLTGNAQIVSINAADLAAGVGQGALNIYHNDISGSNSYRPTNMHDSATADPMWLIQNPDDGTHINVTKMENILSSGATFTNTSLSLPAGTTFSSGDVTPLNPDGTALSDIDTRILKAGEYKNTIAATQKIKISGTESDVQWYAIDVSGTPAFQQVGGAANVGRIGFGDKTYSSDPAIDINSQGDIGLGFMESDTASGKANSATGGFLSTFVTARRANDTAGAMQPIVLVPAGTGTGNINGRIGDFSGMNVDPANGTFWHVNEFGGAGGPTDIVNFTPEDRPVVTAPSDQTAVEGASKVFNLGSFVDADGSPWTVKISWGDGSTTVFPKSSTGSLGMLSHTYAEEGSDVVTVTVTDNTTLSDSKTFNVSVSDPSVIPTGGFVVSAAEGADSGNQTVATFTDPGAPEAVGNYSALINWGDGTAASAGTITFVGGTTFKVTGNHTYAEESAADHAGSNPYAITVTISHGTAPDAVASSTAIVSDPAVTPTGSFVVNAVERADSGPQTVATFTDPAGEPLTDYSAVINWGDGTAPTIGAITLSGGIYNVTGNHTYAEESAADHAASNPYAITITISHESAPDAIAHSTAVVSDPAVTPTGGFSFIAVEGTPSAVQTVATFTDPGGPETLGDYSALIDWGDGTAPTAGTISLTGTVYTVQGGHTYATGLGLPGDFGNTFCGAVPPSYHKPIKVTITHEGAPSAQTTSDAMISLPPASAHLAGGSLIVVGTTSDDHIVVTPVGNTGAVDVRLNSTSLGTFTLGVGGRIIVAALAGNDDIQIAGGVRLDTVLYGGPGDDRIKGGGGRNIQVGCDGSDMLIGGNSGDLLIGGAGADRLIGGHGNDIFVAGNIVDSSNIEDVQYNDLVNVLSAGLIPPPLHAVGDGVQNVMTGASGLDTFYGHFQGGGVLDIVTDKDGVLFNV
jgi:Ca2+-binding RTX toxin-like protein